ncbi:hypothetical protein LCGC14_1935580, partial [marine sediment metagenome]
MVLRDLLKPVRDRRGWFSVFIVAFFLIVLTRVYGMFFTGAEYPVFYIFGFFLIDAVAIYVLWPLCPVRLR